MSAITLKVTTTELAHDLFQNFKNDPALFASPSEFVEYIYDPEKVDAYVGQQTAAGKVLLSIMREGRSIGEIRFKHMDKELRECELGIVLQNDEVKGKGYGSEAVKQAISYAFEKMQMKRICAKVLLNNRRSRHVVEKNGFVCRRTDDMFAYYVLEK